MNILVTGGKGFIGKNLIYSLSEAYPDAIINCFDKENTLDELKRFVDEADVIFHLAGINRPKNASEFYEGNSDLTKTLCDSVESTGRNIPILVSSSIHAEKDNDYGKSKKIGEDYLFDFAKRTQNDIKIFRLHNVFGKWSNPNYNSVVSTFCYNIANDLEITINDKDYQVSLVYIDDVVEAFISSVQDKTYNQEYNYIQEVVEISLGNLASTLYKFKDMIESIYVPITGDKFTNNLYSTFLSYLPKEKVVVDLLEHKDQRGKYTELIRTLSSGQFSVSHSKPGILRGRHYHHSKNERFIVAYGEAEIKLRKIDDDTVWSFKVSGENIQMVNILPGYTHSIENIGDTDMILLIWTNDLFDKDNPDTIYLEV